ncbi:MAG TPA: OmpA family protein [Polyangiaceae bacterium]|jgi:outer membrane protein OmpA-like peptidoglycan-associated protein
MRTRTITIASALLATLAGSARAEGPFFHARASAGHALTEPQASELGWGGGGALVLDVPIGKYFGLELGGAALALSQGEAPSNPAFAQRQAGTVFGVTGGVRFSLGHAWIDGAGGVAATGNGAQPMVQVNLGYDFHARGRWYAGPFVGYTQIADLGDTLRPGDARVLLLGFQISFGEKSDVKPPVFLAKAAPPPHVAPAKLPSDRDGDGVVDAEDACPDVFGVPTPAEPSTNGCPPTTLKLTGDRIELPDRIYFDFDSPSVKAMSLPLLRQIAEYIQARGDIEQVDVDGYADQIGTEEYNVELSRLRAENVKSWLIQYGVGSRLVTHGFGDTNPRVHGKTIDQLRENRRVEFYVQRSTDAAFHLDGEAHASNP